MEDEQEELFPRYKLHFQEDSDDPNNDDYYDKRSIY